MLLLRQCAYELFSLSSSSDCQFECLHPLRNLLPILGEHLGEHRLDMKELPPLRHLVKFYPAASHGRAFEGVLARCLV